MTNIVKKPHLSHENYQTFQKVHKFCLNCEMKWELIIINFMKAKNHFNHFGSIFTFFNTP